MDYLFKALLSVAIVGSGIILICGGLLTLILWWKLVIWLARCKHCISEKLCDDFIKKLILFLKGDNIEKTAINEIKILKLA